MNVPAEPEIPEGEFYSVADCGGFEDTAQTTFGWETEEHDDTVNASEPSEEQTENDLDSENK